jgi:hypothetical protein
MACTVTPPELDDVLCLGHPCFPELLAQGLSRVGLQTRKTKKACGAAAPQHLLMQRLLSTVSTHGKWGLFSCSPICLCLHLPTQGLQASSHPDTP